MTSWELLFSKQSRKDAKKLEAAHLKDKVQLLLDVIAADPFASPPSYEKLSGDLKGWYSRRINIQHRLVYEVDEANHEVKILRMWTHYE